MSSILNKSGFIIKAIIIAVVTMFYSLLVMLAMLLAGKKVFFPFSSSWSEILLKISRVRVKINGSFPASGEYVFVCNHSSMFDIPVLLASIPLNTAIIYKKELEKVPVFGWGLAMSPFVGVKRENPRMAVASIDVAVNAIGSGTSVIVFPEGTRSQTGELGQFKRGAFLLASRSGKPIIPVTIKGTNNIMPGDKLQFKSGNVEIVVHDLILPPAGEKPGWEKQVMNEIREIISGEIERK